MRLINHIFRAAWRQMFPVKPDPREVAAIVERAWIDNAEDQFAQSFARTWARDEFQRTVSRFVRDFYRETGTYPVGDHDVSGRRAGFVTFAPRAAVRH